MHLLQVAQIAALKQDEALTKVLSKYVDYADVFLFDLAIELSKNTGINKNTIELQDGKQPPYRPIYSLKPMKVETFKTYIEIHLKTGFIQPSKSLPDAPILFDKKPNTSFCLCVHYWDLNNLTIKNRHLVSLIGEALNQLSRTKQFTQLDLTSGQHQMRITKGDK